MRNLEKLQEHMRNEHAQLKVQIRALEAHLAMLTGAAPAQSPPPAHAPLPGDPKAPLALTPNDAPDDPLTRFEPRR
jgi:hypothetical protein